MDSGQPPALERGCYSNAIFFYCEFSTVAPELVETVPFPLWAIALLVVLPILIITGLVIVIIAICILLMRKKRKIVNVKLEDPEQR